MSKGPSIIWDAFAGASMEGKLMELLAKFPYERWAEKSSDGTTLLHVACLGPNVKAVVALVQSGLVDVNACDDWQRSPAHCAAVYQQPRILEILCAAGANPQACDFYNFTYFDYVLMHAHKDDWKTIRVLLSNGMRLSMARCNHHRITPELKAFECGVLRCRAAVVAMLRVKRAGSLWLWDKFLLKEIAFSIWATRCDTKW